MLKEVPEDLKELASFMESSYLKNSYGENVKNLELNIYKEAYARKGLPQKGSIVYDFGIGPGDNIEELASYVGETGLVYGIDISKKLIEKAKKIVDSKSLKNVKLYAMDARHIEKPLEYGKADAVYVIDTMNGLNPDSTVQLLEEAVRSCKPEGSVVVGLGTPIDKVLKIPEFSKLLEGVDNPAYLGVNYEKELTGHDEDIRMHYFSKLFLEEVLRKAGCSTEAIPLYDKKGADSEVQYLIIATKNKTSQK